MTAPIADPKVRKLREVRDLPSLTAYLRDELEWPIADWDIEDLTFTYTAEEAGLDAESAHKVNSIRRLRPLSNDAPWGIFFIDFVPGDLPITVLRRILRAVVVKKREAGRPDRQAWQLDDLLFISALGPEGNRDINLARFNEDPQAKVPTLRVVEWDEADTTFHMLRTADELRQLAWRVPGETDAEWRERWANAFTLKPRQAASSAKDLAAQMAALATRIRIKVNDAMAVEGANGPLRKLFRAFKEVLLHDLTEDGFADMYAQTITYGMFAARRSRPMGVTLENAKDMVPSTNPFLRDLLAQFTDAAGLTQSLDFDELGVDALIATLNAANVEAIVDEWGRNRPGEDLVIHFYEDFLKLYDKKQKVQRGVFYTPRPVVSFIVRSVHELLQTEFKLPDGLASTETWGDMQKKFPDLKIPDGATADTPFVQVLDPAVGTGTFLVEVIQVIHDTMTKKWAAQGIKHGSFEWQAAWNDYVPNHLLTRIYGYELMMASYTICHMKVGLKLAELGYKFGAAERLRIYLTNTLEPPQDFSGRFDIMAPALAHEARAVNEVKRNTRFTVIVGNPPYSKISANLGAPAVALIEPFRMVDGAKIVERGALALELALQDDYVKFYGFMLGCLQAVPAGIGAYISNFRFLNSSYLRGMRQQLISRFARVDVVDLGGDRVSAKPNEEDENVFDIDQGVAIAVCSRPPNFGPGAPSEVRYARLYGSGSTKCEALVSPILPVQPALLEPRSPWYRFVPGAGVDQLAASPRLNEVFQVNSGAIITSRDNLTIGFDADELIAKVTAFVASPPGDRTLMERIGFSAKPSWDIEGCKRALRSFGDLRSCIRGVLYRPFDPRLIFYHPKILDTPSRPVSDALYEIPGNLALLAPKVKTTAEFSHVFVSRWPAEKKAASHDRATQMFPLYVYGAVTDALGGRKLVAVPNVSGLYMEQFRTVAGESRDALDLLHYTYAVLHSPGYRQRYGERNKEDFPEVPFTSDGGLAAQLIRLGTDLVGLHLVDSTYGRSAGVAGPRNWAGGGVRLVGGSALIEPRFPMWEANSTHVSRTASFTPVPADVWHYSVGGYQPAQKWLKDRRGRTLTDEDIEHYKRIIGAITETIRIQKEIDEVIEAHGGWPAAFAGGAAGDAE